ncbi:MAG: Holliday junction branch migration protein RuvA [Firmicutes bacterium]|nr:Holliday junction branch migration protein RuvA [Bacillota bacterium]
MIAELSGTVSHKESDQCVVNVGGVGYLVHLSARTASALPGVGERVHLYTHLLVREEEWRLVGFSSPEERRCFLDLISVSGVGPKLALQVMGQFSVPELEEAVRRGEWERIRAVPGVGTKLAQRLQLELGSRWKGREPARESSGVASGEDEALLALTGLGYRPEEAKAALAEVAAELPLPQRIREALRRLDQHLKRTGG